MYLSRDLTGEKLFSQFLFPGYPILSANVEEVCAVNNAKKNEHFAERGPFFYIARLSDDVTNITSFQYIFSLSV